MKERLSIQIPYPDPRWLRESVYQIQRLVKKDNQVVFHGVPLKFPDASIIADGLEVEVRLGADDFLYAEPSVDVDARIAAQEAQRQQKEVKLKEERDLRRSEALKFNQSLQLPVKWSPGIKVVLSGLSEHSWGDGRNARTVTHVLLDEPLLNGRLRRKTGDLLCTSANGSNGKNWSGQKQEDGGKVSCKTCLHLAKRMRSDGDHQDKNNQQTELTMIVERLTFPEAEKFIKQLKAQGIEANISVGCISVKATTAEQQAEVRELAQQYNACIDLGETSLLQTRRPAVTKTIEHEDPWEFKAAKAAQAIRDNNNEVTSIAEEISTNDDTVAPR